MEKKTVERFAYDIMTNYQRAAGLPVDDDVLWRVVEMTKDIYLKTASVPELNFSRDLLELLCQNKIKILPGFMSEEEMEELNKTDGIELEMFINSDELISNGKIRPDVAFRMGKKYVVFEVDSFQYHSTQEQITRDKIRERKIQSLGYPVYRFAAKEILKDSWGAATEAYKILEKEGLIR